MFRSTLYVAHRETARSLVSTQAAMRAAQAAESERELQLKRDAEALERDRAANDVLFDDDKPKAKPRARKRK